MAIKMKNRIYHIDKEQAKEYLKEAKDHNSKVVMVDFKKISSWREYSEIMEKALNFPRPCEGNPNRFLDWMRDLTWYDYDRYDIFCCHFNKLSSKHFEDAYEIYQELKDYILPFWEYQVIRCMVEGKPKAFNVYFY